MSGYPTFVMSIAGIGLLTAVIGDLASHVGCTIGLKDTITAIGFVALGTSVPGNSSFISELTNPPKRYSCYRYTSSLTCQLVRKRF